MIIQRVVGCVTSSDLQGLLVQKAGAASGILCSVENPKLELGDGRVVIRCTLNVALIPRAPATVELGVKLRPDGVFVWIRQVSAKLAFWSFDGAATKDFLLKKIAESVKGKPGMTVKDGGLLVDPVTIAKRPGIALEGTLKCCDVRTDGIHFEIG